MRWFFGLIHPGIPYSVDRKNQKNLKICVSINRDIHTFMSFGVLEDYAKSLFASSPCTHRFFPSILRIKILSIYTIWDRLSLKPFHASVPLGSPGIDFKESILQAYEAWRAGTTTLFLLGP